MEKSYEEQLLESLIAIGEEEEIRYLEEQLYNIDKFHRWGLDPIAWLDERFGEDPRAVMWSLYPEYKGHSWDGDIDPLAKAWNALAAGDWTAVESATGTGKTHFLSRVTYWFLDCFFNSLVVTSAPKEQQLKLHLWSEISRSFGQFKKIRPYAELTTLKLRVDGRRSTNENESDQNSHMAVGFIAGIKANEESTTKAQGFHRSHMLIITEETPGMPLPTLNAFENTSTGGHNLICAVGNPDAITDPLHTFIESYPNKVVPVRISALDHPNIVKGIEIIPGAVTQTSINNRLDKYDLEHPFYKSRVRGICPKQSASSLIRYDWFMSCVPGEPEYVAAGEILRGASRNAVGVDVANSETGDMAALAWGRANELQELQQFQCPNSNHLAYNLLYSDKELAERRVENYHTSKVYDYEVSAANIGVDPVGVGAGTVNAFLQEGYEVASLQGGQKKEYIPTETKRNPKTLEYEEVLMYEFNSWRSQAYWQLADDLQHRRVIISIRDKALRTQALRELLIVRYSNKGYKIAVEPKEEIKKRLGNKSPNLADCIVYWNWVRQYGESDVIDLPFLV